MTPTQAVFAIPGDMHRRTGGFIYEATALSTLNRMGFKTQHLQLPDSFPDPTQADMAKTLNLLDAVPHTVPIILDGLVFGAIDPEGLAKVPAPVVAMIHHPLGLETGLSRERADFLLDNEAAALSHAAHVFVPSPHTANILQDKFGVAADKITICLPGFAPVARTPQRTKPPLILSVGLLAPRKGHDVLLNALAHIRDLDWQASIVGAVHDPITARTLHEQADRLHLSDRVTFAGELAKDALQSLYSGAHIFALATRYEGYGMVLSEAMQYGLPVLSCRTGAVPDTVGNGGILTDVDDVDGFANALRDLLTQPDLHSEMATNARRIAENLPTWEDTARRMAAVLDTL